MKYLRMLLMALVPTLALSQATQEVGNWPNDTSPTGFARFLVEEGCASYNPCTGTTQNIALFQIESFASQTSGNNNSAVGTCTGGCSFSGNYSANQLNGLAIPINCSLATTNAAGQLICITPTVGTCLQVANAQIAISCMQLGGFTIATLPTCNGAAQGLEAYVTNGQTSPPYLGAVSATGAVVAPVFCNGSGWVYH